MQELLNSHFVIFLLLGIFVIFTIPLLLMIRLLIQILDRFRQLEADLKKLKRDGNKK